MKTEMFTTNSCFKSGCPRHKWWWGDLATSCLGWGMVAVSHCARKGAGLSQLFLLQAAWHLGAWSQRYWLKSSVLLWESTDTEILNTDGHSPLSFKDLQERCFPCLVPEALPHTPGQTYSPSLCCVSVISTLPLLSDTCQEVPPSLTKGKVQMLLCLYWKDAPSDLCWLLLPPR